MIQQREANKDISNKPCISALERRALQEAVTAFIKNLVKFAQLETIKNTLETDNSEMIISWVIKKMVAIFQLAVSKKQAHLGHIEKLFNSNEDPTYQIVFKDPLISGDLNKLASLYFQLSSDYGVQSVIREIFFEYIDPLPAIKITSLDTHTISPRPHHPIGKVFKLINDLMPLVVSYLDYESILCFRRSCRSAYFFSKKIQDKPDNIFYMLGDEVQITGSTENLADDKTFQLRSHIPEQELLNSVIKTKLKEVKLFRSLYQALEYSQKLCVHKGVGDKPGKHAFKPSIWIVSYLGNLSNLVFTKDQLTLNAGRSSHEFSRCQRNVAISYANVPLKAIFPLKGAIIIEYEDFTSYAKLGEVDVRKSLNLEPKPLSCESFGCQLV